jgi:FkbM family methyltransferase
MLSKIKLWIPDSIKVPLKKFWRWIRPPRIKLTRFVETGCEFEITTKMEKYRVTNYGDEANTIEKVLAEIKPGDVLYDIGSCVGLYALHAALLGCQVIAFEPDPAYRKRLMRNIKINKLGKKIRVLNRAVSDKPGEVTLYTDGVEGNSPSLRQVGSRGNVIVKTDAIDNLLYKGKIPAPDIIKLDIEGAEILALRGMKNLLTSQKSPRFVFIEFHPDFLPAYDSSFEECRALVESYGYKEVYSLRRANQNHYFYVK